MAQRAKACVTVRTGGDTLSSILSMCAGHIVMHLQHYILVFI